MTGSGNEPQALDSLHPVVQSTHNDWSLVTVTRGYFIGYFSHSIAPNGPSQITTTGYLHQGSLRSPLKSLQRPPTPPLRKKTTRIITRHQDPSAIQAVAYISCHNNVTLKHVDSICCPAIFSCCFKDRIKDRLCRLVCANSPAVWCIIFLQRAPLACAKVSCGAVIEKLATITERKHTTVPICCVASVAHLACSLRRMLMNLRYDQEGGKNPRQHHLFRPSASAIVSVRCEKMGLLKCFIGLYQR